MPNAARIRRDSGGKGKGVLATKGFTIIELMVIVALVLVIGAFAIPLYQASVEQKQLSHAAMQVNSYLSAARREAVNRNEQLAVNWSRTSGRNWCIGLIAGDRGCDCTLDQPKAAGACVLDGRLRVLSSHELNFSGILRAADGDGRYVFDPSREVNFDASGRRVIDEAELELLSEDRGFVLNIQMTPTGQVRTCRASDSPSMPGHRECVREIR